MKCNLAFIVLETEIKVGRKSTSIFNSAFFFGFQKNSRLFPPRPFPSDA